MTAYSISHLSDCLAGLNKWYETVYPSVLRIRLEGPVHIEDGDGEPTIAGRIIFDEDADQFVFVPGQYENY